MQDNKGHCRHGEFNLLEGCPQCIEERRLAEESTGNPPPTPGSKMTADIPMIEVKLPATEIALVTSPVTDAEVMSYYNEALKLQQYAESRVIATVEDIKLATDDLSIIARIKKALEEKRKGYVKPLQDHVKEINDAFKTFMTPIEQADTITRGKILGYQKEQEIKRAEQEEINRLREEAAEKQKRLTGEIIDVEKVEVVAAPPHRISTDMGMVGQRMIRKWELIDMIQVPEDYKILDSAKITKVVKAGIPSIPGIRIFNEPIITVKAR